MSFTDNPNQINIRQKSSFECTVLYKRVFGKQLGFIYTKYLDNLDNLNNCGKIEIKLSSHELIKSIKLGDTLKVFKIEEKNYVQEKLKFLSENTNEKIKITDKNTNEYEEKKVSKNEDYNSIDIKENEQQLKYFILYNDKEYKIDDIWFDEKNLRTLCRQLRLQNSCQNENCKFRHYLVEGESLKLQVLNENKEKAFHEAHKDDPHIHNSKMHKKERNTQFVEFLVRTFGLDRLKSGPVLDIAGGKGK